MGRRGGNTHTPPVVNPEVGAAAFEVVVFSGVGVDVCLVEVGVYLEEVEVGVCLMEVEVEVELEVEVGFDDVSDVVLALQRLALDARFWMTPIGAVSGAAMGARAATSRWLMRAMFWPWLAATAERAKVRRTMHLLMESIF